LLVRGEVVGCQLQCLEQERGAFEVHVVAGEAGGDIREDALDGGAVAEIGDFERVVLEDSWDRVGAVVKAHDFVVHGSRAAADPILFGVVHALALAGWFALVIAVDRHEISWPPPGGGYIPNMVCLVVVAVRCIRLATPL
jgi:hypothetical protein